MSEIYLADKECKINASEALQEIDKQYLGWGWNTEQTTLDLVEYAKDLERQLEEYMEIIKAVAHIGIDWGYGKFELKQDHIDKARKLYEAHEQLKEKGDE